MYWVNEWSHTLAATDALTDDQVLLLPLGTSTVQPVDIACNSLNGLIYTANRLTFAIGVVTTAGAPCEGDVDGSGAIDGGDIALLLLMFGDTGGAGDLDGSGAVDAGDLSVLLLLFGDNC
jgi:hypothetical protein